MPDPVAPSELEKTAAPSTGGAGITTEANDSKLAGDAFLKAMMDEMMGDAKARKRRVIKPYKVTNRVPVPSGYFYLDTNGLGSTYMGRDADIEEGEGYPVYGFCALIRYKTNEQMEAEEEGLVIGDIGGWIVQAGGEDFQYVTIIQRQGEACPPNHGRLTPQYRMRRCIRRASSNGLTLIRFVREEEGSFGLGLGGDVMYIERMFIEPKYRGHGLGLLGIHHLMSRFPSNGQLHVLLAPCPINPSFYERSKSGKKADPFNKELTKEEHDAATKKLGEYYGLMGFHKWTTDEQDRAHSLGLGIWGLSLGYVQNDIRKVLPHMFSYPKARLRM